MHFNIASISIVTLILIEPIAYGSPIKQTSVNLASNIPSNSNANPISQLTIVNERPHSRRKRAFGTVKKRYQPGQMAPQGNIDPRLVIPNYPYVVNDRYTANSGYPTSGNPVNNGYAITDRYRISDRYVMNNMYPYYYPVFAPPPRYYLPNTVGSPSPVSNTVGVPPTTNNAVYYVYPVAGSVASSPKIKEAPAPPTAPAPVVPTTEAPPPPTEVVAPPTEVVAPPTQVVAPPTEVVPPTQIPSPLAEANAPQVVDPSKTLTAEDTKSTTKPKKGDEDEDEPDEEDFDAEDLVERR